MSIDNLTRPQLTSLLDRLKQERDWKHLPQHYAEAGQWVRRAYIQGDHATALRFSVWAATAIRQEHQANKRIATRLFNGQEIV